MLYLLETGWGRFGYLQISELVVDSDKIINRNESLQGTTYICTSITTQQADISKTNCGFTTTH